MKVRGFKFYVLLVLWLNVFVLEVRRMGNVWDKEWSKVGINIKVLKKLVEEKCEVNEIMYYECIEESFSLVF